MSSAAGWQQIHKLKNHSATEQCDNCGDMKNSVHMTGSTCNLCLARDKHGADEFRDFTQKRRDHEDRLFLKKLGVDEWDY